MGGSATVFVVDDDPAVRASITMLLRGDGLAVEAYDGAGTFLAAWSANRPGCLVVDVRMPETDGLELQQRLCDSGGAPPVIVLTGHGDLNGAVRAFRAGAVDFMEKPFDPERLLARVHEALALDRERRESRQRRSEACERMDALTPREREVLEQLSRGAANKVIAANLGISERTVELHRGRLMRKLGVRSVAEVVQLYLSASQ